MREGRNHLAAPTNVAHRSGIRLRDTASRGVGGEAVGCGSPAQHSAGSSVGPGCQLLKLASRQGSEVCPLDQVLAQEPVGVLVAAALLGTLWVAEEDPKTELSGELFALGHLPAPVPGQRPT
jgi:hypothetical protein